ncbi:integrase arm-type DNA-binding domain-containing protein [Brenneria alni]|uniref:integrase arm-type DNA-binding domain-containing protein n=1 Tax=Brenneria alni TaxID=71656 RepID=UPI001472B410
MPLTDLEIRRAKPEDKPYTKNDGNGLSLLIEPNGSKGWRYRYRFDGKAKLLSLGIYPTISLAEARQKRDEAKKLVAAGINPSEVRKEVKLAKEGRLSNTFEVIAREWYQKRVDRWSESYGAEMMKTFEADVFPINVKSPTFQIRISPELHEQLDEVVAKEGVSLGNWFKELARQELRKQGIEPKG